MYALTFFLFCNLKEIHSLKLNFQFWGKCTTCRRENKTLMMNPFICPSKSPQCGSEPAGAKCFFPFSFLFFLYCNMPNAFTPHLNGARIQQLKCRIFFFTPPNSNLSQHQVISTSLLFWLGVCTKSQKVTKYLVLNYIDKDELWPALITTRYLGVECDNESLFKQKKEKKYGTFLQEVKINESVSSMFCLQARGCFLRPAVCLLYCQGNINMLITNLHMLTSCCTFR